jgi:hypothetical protein
MLIPKSAVSMEEMLKPHIACFGALPATAFTKTSERRLIA